MKYGKILPIIIILVLFSLLTSVLVSAGYSPAGTPCGSVSHCDGNGNCKLTVEIHTDWVDSNCYRDVCPPIGVSWWWHWDCAPSPPFPQGFWLERTGETVRVCNPDEGCGVWVSTFDAESRTPDPYPHQYAWIRNRYNCQG